MNDKSGYTLLIDKPQGITSFDVIRILRKKIGIRKMGHAGTLDPMATGLLIIGIEGDTKKLSQFLKLDKVYEAEIEFGVRTDTGDRDGVVVEEKEVPNLTAEEIVSQLHSLVGTQLLPVPIYSAIKKNGNPLYSYARSGRAVEIPLKNMEIKSAEYLSYLERKIKVQFHVGSGTYVRTLAEELGKKLGTVATLSQLRRTSIGDFKVENAETLEI